MTKPPTIHIQGNHIIIPGLATAHSHAFQRALRGRTQRKSTAATSFWSWRGLMYRLAETLTPDDVFQISRFAYAELAMAGVTAVGEFHYLHHDIGGKPYADRLEMADAVIRAAQAVGLRITLIRTAYMRGGYEQELAPAQARFSDPDVEPILADVDALARRYADDPLVQVALAAHSIRAVPQTAITELAAFARKHEMPFHMHVAEQRREIEESLQEYGLSPVALLTQMGVLDKRFVAVHATHLTEAEIQQLGAARAFVCLCRTTERDLGDGLPHTAALVESGVRLCVGVDSHASPDAFEEIRAVELDDRSRTEARHVAATGPELMQIATQYGYESIAQPLSDDRVLLNANDPSLAGVLEADLLSDAIVFGATPRAVDQVIVNGQTIVEGGRHIHYDEILRDYVDVMRRVV